MAFTFLQSYATVSPNCGLLKDNRYYPEACGLLEMYYDGDGDVGALQFEEAELGARFASLQSLVVKSVTSSVTRTASRISTPSGSSSSRSGLNPTRLGQTLDAIEEDETPVADVKLEMTAPRWDRPGWLDQTTEMEAYFPDVSMHGAANVLDTMMENEKNIKVTTTNLTIHSRSKPFAQGGMRFAAYARTASSKNKFVMKSPQAQGSGKDLAHFTENMRCQALCKRFSLEFSALSEARHSFDFVTTACLVPRGGKKDQCMALEPFIHGKYVKYNNNSGWVNKDKEEGPFHHAAQAFSHFTFERSQGRFLVSDLQGVGQVLTDPAVHTRDPERFPLTRTNLGEDGFKFFFATHTCNDVCRELGLLSTGAMVVLGEFSFRTAWPPLAIAAGEDPCVLFE